MQKTAQKRSLPSKLREMINMPGAYLEGFFKPEMDRVMTALKALDDKIRSELVGKKIGTAEAPEIEKSAKDLLKSARTNFNRREYISGIADLGMFHKKMDNIIKEIDKWEVDVNRIHNKFLFEGVEEDRIKKLREYMERKARMEATEKLIKEAGIMDFFYNIGTKRGRSLAAWEKKYPKETKALREGGSKLLDNADALLADTISRLKEMATARAIRRPDDYMDAANKIKAAFAKFDSGDRGFTAYYQNAILPFMQVKDKIEADEAKARAAAEAASKAKEAPKGELITPVAPPPGPPSPPPTTPPMGGPPGTSAPPATTEEEAPITERKPTVIPTIPDLVVPPPQVRVEEPKVRVAHQQFIKTLESLSGEGPLILASFISKYATSIQDKDPETAISLFALARQIKG